MRRSDMQQPGFMQTLLLGVIALAILVPTGWIVITLVNEGHQAEAIALVGPLAGSVVAFFFAHGSTFLAQAGATAQRQDLLALVNPVVGGATPTIPSGTPSSSSTGSATAASPSGSSAGPQG